METRAVIKFFFFPLQGKALKEIHAIVTETLACFLPGQAKDLSTPLYIDSFSTVSFSLYMQMCSKWKMFLSSDGNSNFMVMMFQIQYTICYVVFCGQLRCQN